MSLSALWARVASCEWFLCCGRVFIASCPVVFSVGFLRGSFRVPGLFLSRIIPRNVRRLSALPLPGCQISAGGPDRQGCSFPPIGRKNACRKASRGLFRALPGVGRSFMFYYGTRRVIPSNVPHSQTKYISHVCDTVPHYARYIFHRVALHVLVIQ